MIKDLGISTEPAKGKHMGSITIDDLARDDTEKRLEIGSAHLEDENATPANCSPFLKRFICQLLNRKKGE